MIMYHLYIFNFNSMTALLKRFLLFVLPIIGLGLALFILPNNRKHAYLSKSNVDCNTSWIYFRLFENRAPIDLAFIGTSHTGCGINDGLIQSNIHQNTANLAYCGGGRNIDYLLIQDLIQTKKPKTVVIEVKNQNDYTHRDYAILASTLDLLIPPQMSENYVTNVYTGFKSRLNLFRNNLIFGFPLEKKLTHDSLGMPIMTKEHVYLTPYKKYRKVLFIENETNDNSFSGIFNDSISEEKLKEHLKNKQEIRFNDIACIQKMINLLREENVHVVFLYIPSYGNYFKQELLHSAYAQLAPIVFPPEELFNNKGFWIDQEHFNNRGAKELSSWVSNNISLFSK